MKVWKLGAMLDNLEVASEGATVGAIVGDSGDEWAGISAHCQHLEEGDCLEPALASLSHCQHLEEGDCLETALASLSH